MKKTYQPFIIRLCNAMFEELGEDINPTDRNKSVLCELLTQKFIDGKLSEGDEQIFDSEDEIDAFLSLCWANDNLTHLHELGLIGTYDDGDSYFLTESGKVYVEKQLNP